MSERRIVYTSETVDFKTWCAKTQERFAALGLQPFDETALRTKHAYEFGNTPDSWAREVEDGIHREARRQSNKSKNEY